MAYLCPYVATFCIFIISILGCISTGVSDNDDKVFLSFARSIFFASRRVVVVHYENEFSKNVLILKNFRN